MRALPALLLASALVLASGCAAPERGEPDQSMADEWTLDPRSFYLPAFEADGPMHARATVRVLSGGPIDAFLASGAECSEYPTGTFEPLGRILSSTNGSVEADLPSGRACLVLDNHDAPPGTSPGNGTVRVSYRIELWRR